MKEALKLALEALGTCGEDEWHSDDDYGMMQVYDDRKVNEAITAIKEALAQPEQEPVAWRWKHGDSCWQLEDKHPRSPTAQPLYTTPPKRPWVGLTDEDCKGMSAGDKVVAMWAARTLKEKNT